jgi:hypothetical protein
MATTLNPQVQKYLVDPFERAGSTFAQQFGMFLLAAGGSLLASQKFLAAADSAAFAAVIALITSYVLLLTGIKVTGWFDVLRRVVMTFGQSLGGTLAANTVTHSVVHAGWTAALAIAVNVAGVAFLKSLVGLALPNSVGGSVAPIAPLPVDAAGNTSYDSTLPAITDYSTVATGAVGAADASRITPSEPPMVATPTDPAVLNVTPAGTQVTYTPEHSADPAADLTTANPAAEAPAPDTTAPAGS